MIISAVWREITCAESEHQPNAAEARTKDPARKLFDPMIALQAEEAERAVSEEEMEAAALAWSKGLTSGPVPHERQHPV